ncbi:hypothetical protein NOCA2150140 [metagenome]|uniref:Uncharacterized protein n=1 Tax=metagenome TaxID=256318 RepID=A0A2P2BXC1_9ZZZZ
MDGMKPLLGPPVEPPQDVWSSALANAFRADPGDAEHLEHLVPEDEQEPVEVSEDQDLDDDEFHHEPDDGTADLADQDEWNPHHDDVLDHDGHLDHGDVSDVHDPGANDSDFES